MLHMRDKYRERRDFIVRRFNELGLKCHLPRGAFYAFPNTSGTGIASRVLEDELLNEAGVACLAGTSFGASGEGYMRFSYANSAENIREGLRRVRAHLEQRGS